MFLSGEARFDTFKLLDLKMSFDEDRFLETEDPSGPLELDRFGTFFWENIIGEIFSEETSVGL
jgi:hypothetical protein